MSVGLVRVLLVGSGARRAVALQDHLVRHGCSVRTATTLKDAAACLGAQRFAVVLSEFLLPDGSGYDLIPLLVGADVTLFCSDDLQTSCWWMRVLAGGVDSSHKPGMSPEKFRVLLNEIVFDKMLEYATPQASDHLTSLAPAVRSKSPSEREASMDETHFVATDEKS